jgi:hypothetical protein
MEITKQQVTGTTSDRQGFTARAPIALATAALALAATVVAWTAAGGLQGAGLGVGVAPLAAPGVSAPLNPGLTEFRHGEQGGEAAPGVSAPLNPCL